jgi:hypothetical protein
MKGGDRIFPITLKGAIKEPSPRPFLSRKEGKINGKKTKPSGTNQEYLIGGEVQMGKLHPLKLAVLPVFLGIFIYGPGSFGQPWPREAESLSGGLT